MKTEDLELLVRENVQTSIKENINREEQLDESTGIIAGVLATLSLGGVAWVSLRNAVLKATRNDAFEQFIKEYDTQELIYRRVPDLVRRFQLVKSLNDLDTIERRAEELVREIENLETKVDVFVSRQDELGSRIRDRVTGLSSQRLRREITNHINDIVASTRKGFQTELENKKDELLGEI